MAYFILALAAAQAAASAPIQPAQTAAVAPAAPQAMILAPQSSNVLRAGVEVPLRVEENLSSNDKTVREGNQIRMSVASDVWLFDM